MLSGVQRWLRPGGRRSGGGASYEVVCACGQVARGQRQARHQVIRCSACQQPVFILPASPLPRWSSPDGPAGNGTPAPAAARPAPGRFWVRPLLAGLVTLAVVAAVLAVVLRPLLTTPSLTEQRHAADPTAHIKAGRAALEAGKFRVAAGELRQARSLLEQQPDRLRTPEGRKVVHLGRQADLLADLLTEPLGEILQGASGHPDDEWQAQFAERYRGHSVVFDADVTRDGAGQFRLDFFVRAGREPARLDVNDLKLLPALPRDRPARLLFGARLAGIAREKEGVWVVRFEPDSGVLLTDLAAVTAACPAPIDEELTELVRRQERWQDELP